MWLLLMQQAGAGVSSTDSIAFGSTSAQFNGSFTAISGTGALVDYVNAFNINVAAISRFSSSMNYYTSSNRTTWIAENSNLELNFPSATQTNSVGVHFGSSYPS